MIDDLVLLVPAPEGGGKVRAPVQTPALACALASALDFALPPHFPNPRPLALRPPHFNAPSPTCPLSVLSLSLTSLARAWIDAGVLSSAPVHAHTSSSPFARSATARAATAALSAEALAAFLPALGAAVSALGGGVEEGRDDVGGQRGQGSSEMADSGARAGMPWQVQRAQGWRRSRSGSVRGEILQRSFPGAGGRKKRVERGGVRGEGEGEGEGKEGEVGRCVRCQSASPAPHSPSPARAALFLPAAASPSLSSHTS